MKNTESALFSLSSFIPAILYLHAVERYSAVGRVIAHVPLLNTHTGRLCRGEREARAQDWNILNRVQECCPNYDLFHILHLFCFSYLMFFKFKFKFLEECKYDVCVCTHSASKFGLKNLEIRV